jgi:hypothetical protein
MSQKTKSTVKSAARNWDLALTSSALLVIVGGLAYPRLSSWRVQPPWRRLGETPNAEDRTAA